MIQQAEVNYFLLPGIIICMETSKDIIIHNWQELQVALFQDSWDKNINRYRSSYVYRGLWNKNFDLKTSLIRLGGAYDQLEPHLLRNFRKYAHNNASPGNSDRKSTRLNSSHANISYAVFCLKKI